MRWPTKSRPLNREYRIKIRFAILPIDLDNRITVWLERYVVVQQFDAKNDFWIDTEYKTYESY